MFQTINQFCMVEINLLKQCVYHANCFGVPATFPLNQEAWQWLNHP